MEYVVLGKGGGPQTVVCEEGAGGAEVAGTGTEGCPIAHCPVFWLFFIFFGCAGGWVLSIAVVETCAWVLVCSGFPGTQHYPASRSGLLVYYWYHSKPATRVADSPPVISPALLTCRPSSYRCQCPLTDDRFLVTVTVSMTLAAQSERSSTTHHRNLNGGDAAKSRDAMAKEIYRRLFGWIVDKVRE